MARRVEHYRSRSGTAKLHLALSALPQFVGLTDSQLAETTGHYPLYGWDGAGAESHEI